MNLNIGGGAYSLEAPIAVQSCINLYPEVQPEGAVERVILRRFPGLKSFSASLVGGKIRGIKRMANVAYVVSGTTLYSVTATGVSTSIGTINGIDYVSMATDGTNLVIVNGTTTAYVYNGTTLVPITDADFLAADRVFYLDTYFVFHKTGTNVFFISNSANPLAFTATDIASKEGSQDLIISFIVANRDLVLMGSDTMEYWKNTGDTDFTFQRLEGVFQERGVIGLRSPVNMDNTIYFLGNDRVVYRIDGFRPVRISHHAMETWLSDQVPGVLDQVNGMTITYQGHYWYVMQFSTGTWVYDATASGMIEQPGWFQLQSWDKLNWRVEVVENCYGKTLCGDADGYLYELDHNTLNENGNIQLKQRSTIYYHKEKKNLSCAKVELGFKQGVATSSVSDPQVFMEISKDWGRTWHSRRSRSLGAAGKYNQRAVWRRNGRGESFVFRWSVTDDVDVDLTGAYGEFGLG